MKMARYQRKKNTIKEKSMALILITILMAKKLSKENTNKAS